MECIFCKIVAGTVPAHVVYEDDDFIAFLDIFPVSKGHVQVIPKEHHRWVWDVPNAGAYFEVCKKIAHAQRKAFDVEVVQIFSYGNEVEHAHLWVVPHTEGGHVLTKTGNITFDEVQAPRIVEDIKKHIS